LFSGCLINLPVKVSALSAWLSRRGHFWVSLMPNEKIKKPPLPHCPSCAQPMRLSGKTRRFNGLADLYRFECKKCDVSHTAEGTAPSELEPKIEIGSWYLDEFGNPTREIKRRD